MLTSLSVLPGNLGDSIADLIANETLRFGGEGLEKLLADDCRLVLGQGQEKVHVVARFDLSGL